MTIPSTGGAWKTSGAADLDNRFLERGGIVFAAIRDYRGAATNMSPGVFSPFAADGQIRTDLFAITKVGGHWTINATPNQGWWNLGALGDRNGPERRPTIRNDDLMILQSTRPFDSSLLTESETVRFTAYETLKPLWKAVRSNLPITDDTGAIVLPTIGQPNYGVGKPLESDLLERQLLICRRLVKQGKELLTGEAYPLVKLTDVGASKKDKQAADAAELTFTMLPDPYMVDVDGTPLADYEWISGAGWTSIAAAS